MKKILMVLFSTSIFLAVPLSSLAQAQTPQVSVVALKAIANQDGSTSVVTPKGDLATLPGAGVSGDVAEIYMGSQGGFWYTDRTGQTVDLSAAVQALQTRRARAAQIPQYAPQPYYQAPPPVQQQAQSSSNAVLTAAAAGMGAMAGAAMSQVYYNAPYGTPMHYGANGNPYYYNNNYQERDLNNLNQNQKAMLYNKRKASNENQAQALQHAQASEQSRQAQDQADQSQALQHAQSSQQARQNQYQNNSQNEQANRSDRLQAAQQNHGSDHLDKFQQQQQWYQKQVQQDPNKFQKTSSNPFSSERGSRAFADREGGLRSRTAGRLGGGRLSGRRR